MRHRLGLSKLAAFLSLAAVSACVSGEVKGPRPAPTAPSPPAAPRPPSPCEIAHVERARAPGLLAEGRLDRALRVLDRADKLCPTSAAESLAPRVSALAELGRKEEARRVAAAIESSKDAPAEARAAAKAAIATADKPDDRSAEALFEGALAAKATGDRAAMQRLFDRAIVQAEREAGRPVVLHLPRGWRSEQGFVWGRDGSWLASIAVDSISISEKRAGFRETRRLEGADVVVLASSPDGKLLASGDQGNTVRVWDVATWKEKKKLVHAPERLEVPIDYLNSLAFSPDSMLLASASTDGGFGGNVRLWDVATWTELRKLEGLRAGGSPVMFSADGKTVSADSYQEGMHTWSVKTGKLAARAPTPPGPPKEQALAEEVVQRWRPGMRVSAHAFSPDKKSLAVVLQPGDKVVHLLKVASAAETPITHGTLPVDPGQMEFSPDGETLAVEDREGVTLVHAASGRVLQSARPMSDENHKNILALSRDGKQLVSGSEDHSVRLWTLAPRVSMRKLGKHDSTVSSVALSPDGRLAASCTPRGVRLWSAAPGEQPRELRIPGAVSLAFSTNGKILAVGAVNQVRLIEVATGAEKRVVTVPKGSIQHIAFSPDSAILAASTGDGTLHLWNADTGEVRPNSKATVFAFSPDGNSIAAASGEALHVTSLRSGAESDAFAGHTDTIRSVAFSPDGALLASGSDDNTLRLWDIATGTERRKVEAQGFVQSIAFFPDQKALVASERALSFWTLAGDPLFALRALANHDAAYAFTRGEAPLVEILGPNDAAASSALRCHAGVLSFPFDLCRERFEVPGLVQKALAGDSSYADP